MISTFNVNDYFMIGTLTMAIGSRKYPINIMHKIINHTASSSERKLCGVYLVVVTICLLINMVILFSQTFEISSILTGSSRSGDGVFVAIKSMVYFGLICTWYFIGFRPIEKIINKQGK